MYVKKALYTYIHRKAIRAFYLRNFPFALLEQICDTSNNA
jgi:hypothetical protein